MTALTLLLGALLAGGVWLAAKLAARVVSWWDVRTHRHDGLQDVRVLRPVRRRMADVKRASAARR